LIGKEILIEQNMHLQALHNYTLYTYVFVHKPMLSRRRLLPLALLSPLIVVLPTAIFSYDGYINENTCWVDYSRINAVVEAVPNVFLALLAVIIGEATPMRKFNPHPGADEKLRDVAVANARASIFISSTSIGSCTYNLKQLFTNLLQAPGCAARWQCVTLR
jgi:hypothetical protein